MFGDAIDPGVAAAPPLARRRDDRSASSPPTRSTRSSAVRSASRCRSPSTGRSSTAPTTSSSPSARWCRTRWRGSAATRSTSRSGSAAARRSSAATSSAPSTGSSRRWARVDAPVRQLLDRGLRPLPRAALPRAVRAHRRRGAVTTGRSCAVSSPAKAARGSSGGAAFRAAAALSAEVNIETVDDAVSALRRLPRSGRVPLDLARRTRRSTARGSRWRTAASSSSSRRACRASARIRSSTR